MRDRIVGDKRNFEQCRQPDAYRIDFRTTHLTIVMMQAQFRRNPGIGNVPKGGPIWLSPRKSQDLADRSPVTVAVHHIRVGQCAINVEDDQVQVGPRAFRLGSERIEYPLHPVSKYYSRFVSNRQSNKTRGTLSPGVHYAPQMCRSSITSASILLSPRF